VQLLHDPESPMPIIKRFPQYRLVINERDHNPPHFHVRMNDGREVWVKIDGMEIIHGRVAAREIVDALKWARENRLFLMEKFEELQQ